MKLEKVNIQWTKKKLLLSAISVVIILAIVVSAIAINSSNQEEVVYKETQVQYGTLTVGVTESGSVDIGTVEQSFELDMSALKRVETGSTGNGSSNSGMSSGGNSSGMGAMGGIMGGGMPSGGGTGSGGSGSSALGGFDFLSQMMGGGSNLVGSGDDSSLTVDSVKVSVGQEVSKGDVLYTLKEDSVSELEQELKDNVNKAKADLEAVYADQTLSAQTAQYTYESSIAYGDFADTEHYMAILDLQDTVESNRLNVEKAQNSLQTYQNNLATMTESYNQALQTLETCQALVNQTDQSEIATYVTYYNQMEQAQLTVDTLKQQIEQLERNVDQAITNTNQAWNNYNASQRKLDQGVLSADETLALRELAYNTAKETYDITMAYLEQDVETQKEIYEETKAKWDEFSSYISNQSVLAQYNGVITSVELAAGDSISTGSALVTLYDMDDVSMTVSVYEQDMESIVLGSKANIAFTAYPDELFEAEVSYISDASTDSNGNVLYEVTIGIKGDVSGLFQGMTGDITFITKQSEETLYVAKRAIITENDKSYVKVKDADGNIKKIEVTTGFTDGTYIQIVEGLAEGDTVLIESKVSK